ncbi:MAG: 50S ribosomal protein L35 [Candidatus Collierbacteria bacterium GW2011_GWF1_44_12]|uniref:Large ribosomal subunit protein bL35 n=2 Tax=Candidatus Collieribacteriota TaxID=1752725 RepID=A0A0G1S2E7_9BACT|nr:MAG: 50S ribosomal protein L35 [Candidatus Collierbacteria bacterium GW2011_GWF1_44_12]KKU27385.1 MAG: 50S ribosomal protein L35 [Candidatus Collierbacteria bacterium GW2011_GWE1_46_18]
MVKTKNKTKQKTRKIVMKRFKITGTGKVLRRSPYMRHLRRKKSRKLVRRYRHYVEVTGRLATKIKSMLHM